MFIPNWAIFIAVLLIAYLFVAAVHYRHNNKKLRREIGRLEGVPTEDELQDKEGDSFGHD